MKKNERPSLELCKKLTSLGLPDTENVILFRSDWTEVAVPFEEWGKIEYITEEMYNNRILCPTIIDMIELIPLKIQLQIGKTFYDWMIVFKVEAEKDWQLLFSDGWIWDDDLPVPLADAIANILISLVENKNIILPKVMPE